MVVVIGERPYAEMMGDSKDLSLPAEDLAVLKRARESGVPVVTVVLSGRPVMLGPVLESSDAVIAAWLPGTEGAGVADVLLRRLQTDRQAPPHLAAIDRTGAVQWRRPCGERTAVSLWVWVNLLID